MRSTHLPGRDRHDLLSGFLAGDKRTHNTFYETFKPVMMRQARKVASDLPEDLWEEIVQGAFLILHQTRLGKYDSTKGTPEGFVGLAVWDSMRRVRSDNAPPGQMTRRENERKKQGASPTATPPAPDAVAPPAPPQVISLDELGDTLGTGLEDFVAVEHRLDAEKVMARVDPTIGVALRLIHWDDMSKADAAIRVALPRTTLTDRLETFSRQFALAA